MNTSRNHAGEQCMWVVFLPHNNLHSLSDSFSDTLIEQLAFLPYLVFLEVLRRFPGNSEEGRVFREQALEVGVVNNILQCLRSMGRYSPRRERDTQEQSSDKKRCVCVHMCVCVCVSVCTCVSAYVHVPYLISRQYPH